MQTIINKNNGFSLIEALVAITVLTFGILALNTMQTNSMKGNTKAKHITTASILGGNCYERLLNADYDDSELDPGGNPHNHTEFSNPTIQLPAGATSVTWNVTEWTNTDGLDNDGDGTADETDEMNIKNITLSINYFDRSAKTITINFLKSEMM